MEVNLLPELFENNTFTVSYGNNKEATFTIVNEEFAGDNTIGRVNCVTIVIRDTDTGETRLGTAVIGMGDGVVGIKTTAPELLGKVMTSETMSSCVAELYE